MFWHVELGLNRDIFLDSEISGYRETVHRRDRERAFSLDRDIHIDYILYRKVPLNRDILYLTKI